MALLTEDAAGQIREAFTELKEPVRLAVFFQALADPPSEHVRRLVDELAALDSRLSVLPYNFVLEEEKVRTFGIARTPAIAILGKDKDYGIRFYGLPSGYEFSTLIETVLDVSRGEGAVSAETRAALEDLARPVHLQVFSTPT
jgi:alkyl hydroperoxide reductase subunit AhpF